LPYSLVSNSVNFLSHSARYHLQQLLRVADPLYWLCAARARLIVGINPRIGTQFPLSVFGKKKFMSFTAIGVEDTLLRASSKHISSRGLQVLSMGRLVELKGFHLTIMAFAKLVLREPQSRLLIVGEGPSKSFLQRLVKNLNLERKVDFCGWLPRAKALSLMNTADVFLFPSFEGGGMVVLEAMQHELPVICLEYGGPGEMVTGDCGFVVKVGSIEDTVENLARALEALAHNRTLRSKLGAAAKQRVQERYLWRDRHEIIRQWYSTILSKNAGGIKAATTDGLERA
jgi:glycosyltransferase involved in cell wall biosynthesis